MVGFILTPMFAALSSLAAVTLGQDDQLDPLEALANNIPGVPGQVHSDFINLLASLET